jgi:protein associated with RNAse G/E
MDLDVVRRGDRVWIDDEDEFEQHRIQLGYPDELVVRCRAAADHVVGLISARTAPFDGRGDDWLARLESSTPL